MGSILWVPLAFLISGIWLYVLSINLPEHTGSDRSALKFPRNFDDLTALASLLKDYKSDNMQYVMLLFCSAYLFKQTFAIPGSFFMVRGALFGTWRAFPLASLLTACGATCCYLLSQFFGKSYIEKFFPEKVQFMQKKVTDNMDSLFFFLLFLRLFPMSPNWFLNMASPILDVPVHLFFLSVLIGLMPYNFICVQTGSMLSEITSLDGIFTKETTLKLFGIATVALLPGLLINKLKEGRLKTN
ncbi:transmembrane protein 41A-A-like [Ruditapes philippinarum]|uniref:transmembrane protein 41A-A-like n=1 Tax=Ruditapes philippinarum TaxID=129788 RepID=UPI00295AFBC9|nr:transmembrane protein 41A-A-like [Ruditapes philippinarum]